MAKGWFLESRRHSLASKGIKTAQKVPRMPKNQNIKNPSIEWVVIENDEMMRDSMQSFLKFLKDFNVDYISYSSEDGKKTYMKLALTNEMVFDKDHEFWKGMGEWSFYNPITSLNKKPKVSDYNIIEDMSVEPYDIDKWGGFD